ncbi:MAG: hypothetical protein A4E58_01334 [Syntrophorhabdus sp. PtaB.Bin006]|nr:MAG: hypothetical protein A4E58_01334 [Syntrophorhabdus sp. PtaB.Bin006]
MESGTLFFQVNLDDLLRIVPGTTGICEKDSLEKPEESDSYQVTDEEIGIEKGKSQREEEDDDEDVDHTLLCILSTDLHDLFAVLDRCLCLIKVDVLLDKNDGTVCTGRNGLCCCAGKPVYYSSTHEKTQDNLGIHKA